MTVVFKTEEHLYNTAKENANYIAEITTELALLVNLSENEAIDGNSLVNDIEMRRKKAIKDAISNIYLMLDLHQVKGNADNIYNDNFFEEDKNKK